MLSLRITVTIYWYLNQGVYGRFHENKHHPVHTYQDLLLVEGVEA